MRDILYRDVPSFEANEFNSGKLFTAYVCICCFTNEMLPWTSVNNWTFSISHSSMDMVNPWTLRCSILTNGEYETRLSPGTWNPMRRKSSNIKLISMPAISRFISPILIFLNFWSLARCPTVSCRIYRSLFWMAFWWCFGLRVNMTTIFRI